MTVSGALLEEQWLCSKPRPVKAAELAWAGGRVHGSIVEAVKWARRVHLEGYILAFDAVWDYNHEDYVLGADRKVFGARRIWS